MSESVSARELIDAGLSKSFAHFVVKGDRKISIPTALWLLDERGLTVGPLVGMAPEAIAQLRDSYPAAAPSRGRPSRAA